MAEQPSHGDRDQPRLELQLSSQERGASGAAGMTGDGNHLLEYVRILYKRRWTAVTAFLVVFVGVAVYTYVQTPMYVARTQILIEPDTPDVVSFKGVNDQNKATNDYYQTQYKILQSRALARQVVNELKLVGNPAQAGGPLPRGFNVKSLWEGLLHRGRAAAAAEPPAADETVAESRAIDGFLSAVTISPVRNSRLVDVEFESTNPALAMRAVNTLARSYIEQNLDFRNGASKEAGDWLAKQLHEQQAKVEESEAALQKYREQHDALSLEERQNIVVQKLADLNSAVTKAKTDRLQKEALYKQLLGLQKEHAPLDTFPAILSNPYIQQEKANLANLQQQKAQMAKKLGPRHPDMIKISIAIQTEQAKLQGEIAKVVQGVKNDYLAALSQENSLEKALDQQKQDAMNLNRKGIDYGVLQRDAQTNRQIFDTLLQRTKETDISSQLKTSNIRVVDPAELPQRPVVPDKMGNLRLGFGGGIVLGLGLAFFFEYLDSRIKSPEELQAQLGLPFLGLVPLIGARGDKQPLPMVNNGVPPSFSEAFRGVRTSVLFSSAEEGAQTLLVTSTGPGEGKTMVTTNLAVSLAQMGQRVLLVDADMRRPTVHQALGQDLQPGLSNLMVGSVKVSEAVRRTDIQTMWFMPAGQVPPNPAELLGSKRFRELLETLSQHFDWIILDSPPLMPVTDAAIVSHIVTGVVFVVGAEMTSRHTATLALSHLKQARARVLGAVLNRVNLGRHGYYYRKYYRQEYASYQNSGHV